MKAKIKLEKIDKKIRNSSQYKHSEGIIQHEIWMEIAMCFNESKGDKKEFFGTVMDEYKKKYK